MRGAPENTREPRSAQSLADEFGRAWSSRSCRSEIRMGDFYGGRPLILKYMPWWGSILEAGCGLGRYVFYLRALGYDASGVELSSEALAACRDHALLRGQPAGIFRHGDVRSLDQPDDSLSGYLSLGVVEHFEEGPQAALAEAHRVLAPGGVAVISTPNFWSAEHVARASSRSARRVARRALSALGRPRREAAAAFDQYWFSASRLARFIRQAGFTVTHSVSADLRYAALQLLGMAGPEAEGRSRRSLLPILDLLERTPARLFGGLVFVVAVKRGRSERCFFCGSDHEPPRSMRWTVPVCPACRAGLPRDLLGAYRLGIAARFAARRPYDERRPPCLPGAQTCSRCRTRFEPDPDFGLFGFVEPVCPVCRRVPAVRGRLCLRGLLDEWRPRT